MIEVMKNLLTGLAVAVLGLALFLLTLWLFVATPAWVILSLCFLGFCYCLGMMARSGRVGI